MPYTALGRRGQIGRLRRLAQTALAGYGLEATALTPLRHEHNTTFRVHARGGPFVLRINRPGVHTVATIGSEMAWLRALREQTDLRVPEPVAARDGSLAVPASDPGVPEARVCVLLRWLDGRFVDERLTPRHLRQVARLQAALHEHALSWAPPPGFVRPRTDLLTSEAKAEGNAPALGADAERGTGLVRRLLSAGDAAVVAAALEVVRASTSELDARPASAGLIHGDLHQENYFFSSGRAQAIDFDDCGWGYFLYDFAVTLFELEDRPAYPELRAALLGAYGELRPLPADAETHLAAFALLRRMQLLMWALESREHPAFRTTWRDWAREDLGALAAALGA